MWGPTALLKAYATVRGILAAAVIVALLALLVRLVLIPAYQDVTGFIPFDAQPRLSQVMIGIELGAFAKGAATDAYTLFAMGDIVRGMAVAWFFTLVWAWLFAKAPSRLFGFLARGGIFLVPTYVVILDVAAKLGFYRLLLGLSDPDYSAVANFSVTAHRLSFALADLRLYLTAGFILIAVFIFMLQRRMLPPFLK